MLSTAIVAFVDMGLKLVTIEEVAIAARAPCMLLAVLPMLLQGEPSVKVFIASEADMMSGRVLLMLLERAIGVKLAGTAFARSHQHYPRE
jgi:hypothetical protein